MATMNISLPDALKDFVESQVEAGAYGTSSEFIRDLLRRHQDRVQLRGLLMEGMESGQGSVMNDAYFRRLRERIHSADTA